MGADPSMYGEPFRNLGGIKYVHWPVYEKEQTISEVSERIIKENSIQSNDIVGGSSLGGIVAAEIAKHVRLHKLLLIGSTLNPDNINPVLKKLSTLSQITPVHLIQALAGKVNTIVENRLLKMLSHSETLFIKSMCKAVFEWEGNQKPNCAVAQIHGKNDHVIFPPSTGAKIIQNGGHLIAMTHETCVVEFIKGNTNANQSLNSDLGILS